MLRRSRFTLALTVAGCIHAGAAWAAAQPAGDAVPEAFQVVVECRDETQQQTVYEWLTSEGYKCRLLTL